MIHGRPAALTAAAALLVAGAAGAAGAGDAAAVADPAPAPALTTTPEPTPDPAAVDAGEANLESQAARKDFVVTLGLGGAISIGLGMEDATGQGGAGMLRLAHVANARVMFAIEFVGNALLSNVARTLYRTDVQSFLLSGQYYINTALWLRAGLGFGRFAGDKLEKEGLIFRERFRLAGPTGAVGAGIDLARYGRLRASIEFGSTAMINRDGILSSNGVLLGLSFD
jgi:hypothetical protein